MRCGRRGVVGRPGRAAGRSRRAPRPGCAARSTRPSRDREVAPVLRQPGGEEVRLVEQQARSAARAASPSGRCTCRVASSGLGRGGAGRAPGDLLEGVVEIDARAPPAPARRPASDTARRTSSSAWPTGRGAGTRSGCRSGTRGWSRDRCRGCVVRRRISARRCPALGAVRAGREQQRDVRVVGAGQPVAHEQPGVGVLDADALVVADLARRSGRTTT